MNYFALAALEMTLLGVLSGFVGTLIVLRQRSFFAVALSHATFPGGVIFAIAGWNLLVGQAFFAVLLVLLMAWLGRIPLQGRQVTSSVVLSLGFALGTLLTSLNPGLGIPVEALLVGSPLSVTTGDVWATAVVLVVGAVLLLLNGRGILFETFDPVGFRSAGFRVWPVELIVTGLIAAAVVVSMPAVGAILGVAILIGPAAAARLIAPGIASMAVLAAVFGVGSGLFGLWLSREFGIAAGGAIGCVVTGVFIAALLAKRLMLLVRRRATVGAGRSPEVEAI